MTLPSAEAMVHISHLDYIDGLEAPDGTYVMTQEDSGNNYRERMFISCCLEHNNDGNEFTYYFVAMSGGSSNTRATLQMAVPFGTWDYAGLVSTIFLALSPRDSACAFLSQFPGSNRRSLDRQVAISDKVVLVTVIANGSSTPLLT